MSKTDLFREKLQGHLDKLQLSKKVIARKLGCSDSSMRNWLWRGRVPAKYHAPPAEMLDVSVADLLSWGLTAPRPDFRHSHEELRLNRKDLEKLIEVQQVLGDLTISMVVRIAKELQTQQKA